MPESNMLGLSRHAAGSRVVVLAISALMAACSSQPVTQQTQAPRAAPSTVAKIEVPAIQRPAEENADWWYRTGAAAAVDREAYLGQARNIILFIGDGMGPTTVSAARIFAGQIRGGSGEEHELAFETFPHTALSKTYNTNAQTADSAGTATAMLSGVKTRIGSVNVGQGAGREGCDSIQGETLLSILQAAELAGMQTGIVTTTRITHATPAAAFSHAPNRDWEDDSKIPQSAAERACWDIARQLVEFPYGDGPEILLGGGRLNFLPAGVADPEYPDFSGSREDGRNLIEEWRSRRPGSVYAWTGKQMWAARGASAVLGLFQPSHMLYEYDRMRDVAGEPSLAEMTEFAIKHLADRPQGYVLIVEGGRIDHAHHQGNAFRALMDTVAFADAVAAADRLTSDQDTLIMVTADHSHVMSFAGYPQRGNPILGLVQVDGASEPAVDTLGLPYTTLSYANGPGYTGADKDGTPEGIKQYPRQVGSSMGIRRGRPDLRFVHTTSPDFLQEATVPLHSETHGGEDVAIYARGPGAHAVRGVMEQHVIHHILVQATPVLREQYCALGSCNEDGIPVSRAVLGLDGLPISTADEGAEAGTE